MTNLQDRVRGCPLGLAVGDAMGYAVDNKTLDQIREDYGPNGLLGYDLVNGYAETLQRKFKYGIPAIFVLQTLLLMYIYG